MATAGITVSSLNYSFQTGQAQLSVDTGWTGDILDWFTDLKPGIEKNFASAIRGAMPARLQQGNYDPFTDPELGTRLQAIVNAMSGAFPTAGGDGGQKGMLDEISQPEIGVNISPVPAEIPLDKGMKLVLSERSRLSITAKMKGTMAQAFKHPKLDRLEVWTDGVTLEHKSAGILAGLEIHSLTFGSDLSLIDFHYTLGLEQGAGLLKLLGAMAQMQTGQDLGVRDLNSPEFKAIRADVDKQAREKLPVMLRDQLKARARSLPGLPLQEMIEGGAS